jgi:SAM-dependent methyltransferase
MSNVSAEIRCPICGTPSADLPPWLDIPMDAKTGQPISTGRLVWCKACDLGMMRRAPNPEETAASYDLPSYYTHGKSHIPDVSPGLGGRILMKLAYLTDKGRMMDAETLQARQPGMRKVLDIGCGGGSFVAALAAPNRGLYGIEPDPRAREAATAKGVTVFAGTAEAIPEEIRSQKFDLIILTHALEHCPDPRLAIANVRKLLAPYGLFYCEVPNCSAQHFQTFAEISEMLDVPRHIYFFTDKSLRSLFEAAGFVIEATVHHGYTRHFGPGWRAWENRIHQMIAGCGVRPKSPRRGWGTDLKLLAKTAFAEPARKYDCLGLLARPKH